MNQIRVKLSNRDHGDERRFLVHRLVWRAFRGPIPTGLTINHLNGDRTDNRLVNLELATMSQQMIHAYATGLQKRARGEERINVAKLTESDVRAIRRLYRPRVVTYEDLGRRFGVSESCVLMIVKRRRWTHI